MILPRLCINGSRYRVELYYPECPEEPIAIMSGLSKSVTETFFNMLTMALDNYDDGYCCGYEDAVTNLENEDYFGV